MISIVTAYFNRKKLLQNTLESIVTQNFKGDFEFIVVDDGSKEEERVEDLVELYPFLKVIRLDPNKKWYHNSCIPFNIGFKAAKGDKIILQNPECYHYGNVLQYTIDHLTKNNYLSFSCFSLDKETTENLDTYVKQKGAIENIIAKNDHVIQKDGDAGWYNHPIHRPKAYHFCNAITKKNLNELGGFDEIFAQGIAYDDDDLLHRVKKKKLLIKSVTNPLVLHQNHYSQTSLSYENRKNKELLMKKNHILFQTLTMNNGFRNKPLGLLQSKTANSFYIRYKSKKTAVKIKLKNMFG